MITKYNLGIPIFPTLKVSRSRDRLIFTTVSHIKTLPVKRIHQKYVDKSSLRGVGVEDGRFSAKMLSPDYLISRNLCTWKDGIYKYWHRVQVSVA